MYSHPQKLYANLAICLRCSAVYSVCCASVRVIIYVSFIVDFYSQLALLPHNDNNRLYLLFTKQTTPITSNLSLFGIQTDTYTWLRVYVKLDPFSYDFHFSLSLLSLNDFFVFSCHKHFIILIVFFDRLQ